MNFPAAAVDWLHRHHGDRGRELLRLTAAPMNMSTVLQGDTSAHDETRS